MKVELPLEKLVPIVSHVAEFTAPRIRDIDALTHLFVTKDTLRAFSGEAGAVYKVEWEIGNNVAVPSSLARVLESLARQGHENVQLSVGDKRFSIRCGKFRGFLPLLESSLVNASLMRTVPKSEESLPDSFWSDLARVEPTMSRDETKPMFQGVYWAPDGSFISCDNYRMTMVRPEKSQNRPTNGVLIPEHLLKLLGSRRSLFSRVTVDDNTIWFFEHDGSCVYGTLLADKFPYERTTQFLDSIRPVIGKGTEVKLGDHEPLEKMIDRLLLFGGPKLTVVIGKDNVKLRVDERDGSGSSAEEAVPCSVNGPEAEFNVNATFFKDALKFSTTFVYTEGKLLYFANAQDRVEHVLVTLTT